MARKHRSRQIHILQDSPFLNLAAEIREQIYYAALVRPTPIDLWPLKYTQPPRVFRLQEDLQFVHKEMATCLLTTCKQIFHEASNIFWSKNTFRFSGDIEWFGVRRFLGQIGPRALSQLQSLELFALLADAHCLDTSLLDGDVPTKKVELYTNAREAKNWPKMHMAKARKEPWTGSFSSWLPNNRRLALRDTIFVLTRNVKHVCYLLDMATTTLALKLILPRGFGLTYVYGPMFDENNRRRRNWAGFHDPDPHDLQLPEELLRILRHFTRSTTLVLEAGAQLIDVEMVEQFTNRGINILCQPGSFLHNDLHDHAVEVLVAKQWINPYAEFDYLDGMSTLFDDIQEGAVHALGGRATSTPGPKDTRRILKGFGGCRYVERDTWTCVGCPSKNGTYLHRPTNTRCSVNKVLVIKKKSRAARNGFVNLENVEYR